MTYHEKPEIAIVGAGAVGSLLGGLLAHAGHRVTLIGRSEHIRAIKKEGLHINGASGSFTVECPAAESLMSPPDIIILAVKMQDLESACRTIAPLVKNVPVMTLQNGIGSDALAGSILGKEKIVGGVVLFNAQYSTPGHVTHGSEGALMVGNVPGADEKHLQTVSELLDGIVPVRVSDNFAGIRWTKLFINLIGNSFDALTGIPLGTCMQSRGVSKAAVYVLREAYTITQKTGVTLGSLPGIPAAAFTSVIAMPVPVASRSLRQITKKFTTVSSTLQSLRRGKPTEIDYLNGEIVRFGKKLNIPTPCNTKVVELIKEIEKTETFYSIPQVEKILNDCVKSG